MNGIWVYVMGSVLIVCGLITIIWMLRDIHHERCIEKRKGNSEKILEKKEE